MHTAHHSKLKSYAIVAAVAIVAIALVNRAPAKLKSFVFPAASS